MFATFMKFFPSKRTVASVDEVMAPLMQAISDLGMVMDRRIARAQQIEEHIDMLVSERDACDKEAMRASSVRASLAKLVGAE